MSVQRGTPVPPSRQIAAILRAKIQSGELPPDSKLPSHMTLAAEYDVSPETAFERKREWGVEWLAGHRDLYLEEAGPLKVRVLDGELPREEICAQIAADVWQCL